MSNRLVGKEVRTMKMSNASETIEKLATEKTLAKVYIMAIDAKSAGKSFDEFIDELKTLMQGQ